ncbi:MAG: hypothetical protein WAZ18_05850 [Alphaproteobacteria bacterium]
MTSQKAFKLQSPPKPSDLISRNDFIHMLTLKLSHLLSISNYDLLEIIKAHPEIKPILKNRYSPDTCQTYQDAHTLCEDIMLAIAQIKWAASPETRNGLHFYHARPELHPLHTCLKPPQSINQQRYDKSEPGWVYLTTSQEPHKSIKLDSFMENWNIYRVAPLGKVVLHFYDDIKCRSAVILEHLGTANQVSPQWFSSTVTPLQKAYFRTQWPKCQAIWNEASKTPASAEPTR